METQRGCCTHSNFGNVSVNRNGEILLSGRNPLLMRLTTLTTALVYSSLAMPVMAATSHNAPPPEIRAAEERDDDELKREAARRRLSARSAERRKKSNNRYDLLPELLDEALGSNPTFPRSSRASRRHEDDSNYKRIESIGPLVNSLSELLGQMDTESAFTAADGELMTDRPPASFTREIKLAIGISLLASAAFTLVWHLLKWRGYRKDETLDEQDRRYYRSQFRRTMQMAAILAVLGLMIPFQRFFLSFWPGPGIDGLYWGLINLLSVWVLVLAVVNRISTNMFLPSALARVRRRQFELEQRFASITQANNVSQSTSGK